MGRVASLPERLLLGSSQLVCLCVPFSRSFPIFLSACLDTDGHGWTARFHGGFEWVIALRISPKLAVFVGILEVKNGKSIE